MQVIVCLSKQSVITRMIYRYCYDLATLFEEEHFEDTHIHSDYYYAFVISKFSIIVFIVSSCIVFGNGIISKFLESNIVCHALSLQIKEYREIFEEYKLPR
jgi:hypothetical protein